MGKKQQKHPEKSKKLNKNIQKVKKIKKHNTQQESVNPSNILPEKREQSSVIIGKPWSQIQVELREEILHSLQKNKFTSMFPVQQAAIPLLLKNYDLAVEAQTGSGKTLSFLIPLLQKYLALNQPYKLLKDSQNESSGIKIRYLLISPTRQLCQQSYSTLLKLLRQLPNRQRSVAYSKYCYCATGGNELPVDLKRLQDGAIVLMGTVGRIKQIGQKMSPDWLKKVEYLFIDEADRVLKEKGIDQLIQSIQKLRRTALFSATLQGLQQKNLDFFGMRNLAKISLKAIDNKQATTNKQPEQIKGYVIPKSLKNTYITMTNRLQKIAFLLQFLHQNMNSAKIIVFLSTCACVDYYTKLLSLYFEKVPSIQNVVFGIHGKLKTKRRKRIIQEFLSKQSGVLFATDVVSRGIDFEHVHFIIQVDPPEDPDNYIHRIGRTARVNRPGTAILLIQEHEEAFITYLGDKGVAVQKANEEKFVSKKIQLEALKSTMYEVIATDRDNVEKGKRAFVSYVRAYKQHDLKYIFEFKNVDLGMIAHSFFLFKIPRVKQILGKSISTFKQIDIDIDSIPWLDKNQSLQYRSKQQKRKELREMRENVKVTADIKNIKSKRKKVRRQNQEKQMKLLNKQHKQILKSKKAQVHHDQSGEDSYSDEDTEQIEQRITDKHKKQ